MKQDVESIIVVVMFKVEAIMTKEGYMKDM